MAAAASAHDSVCGRWGLKPLTSQNLLFYYLPIQGVVSYTALSVNVMNPSLVLRLFPRRDITNVLLGHTILGAGLYLYSREHLKDLTTKEKIMYSSFGAVTFTMGSVLIWAILRSIVPQNVGLCTACGIGSGLALLKIGRSYADHVDSFVPKTK